MSHPLFLKHHWIFGIAVAALLALPARPTHADENLRIFTFRVFGVFSAANKGGWFLSGGGTWNPAFQIDPSLPELRGSFGATAQKLSNKKYLPAWEGDLLLGFRLEDLAPLEFEAGGGIQYWQDVGIGGGPRLNLLIAFGSGDNGDDDFHLFCGGAALIFTKKRIAYQATSGIQWTF